MKTVCYFDASNVRHSADANYPMDYEALASFLRERFGVDEIIYFGALFVGDYYYNHNYRNDDYINLDHLSEFLKSELSKGDIEAEKRANLEKTKRELGVVKKIVYLGYATFVKPLKIIYGKAKADCDVNIAVEAMKGMNTIDKLVLVSGDGDLLPLLRHFKKNNKDILLVSFGDNTAKELKKFVQGNWINLSTLRHKLEYMPKIRP